ncbi:MAG TPA: IPT/TIG domain-containing protein [Patescibacteria group bacterium]|nr:IPT/TIG domain-containing protein [Patescibacteria group bacterium]
MKVTIFSFALILFLILSACQDEPAPTDVVPTGETKIDSIAVVYKDINIFLSNYSAKEKPIVHIGDIACEVLKFAPDTIFCRLPENTISGYLKVNDNNSIISLADKILIHPWIVKVDPSVFKAGDEASINGIWYGTDKSKVKVKFGDDNVEVLSVNPTQIQIRVPEGAFKRTVRVIVDSVSNSGTGSIVTTYTDGDFYSCKLSLLSPEGNYFKTVQPNFNGRYTETNVMDLVKFEYASCNSQFFVHEDQHTFVDSCRTQDYRRWGSDPIRDRTLILDIFTMFKFTLSEDNTTIKKFSINYTYYSNDDVYQRRNNKAASIIIEDIPVVSLSDGSLVAEVKGSAIQNMVKSITYNTSSYSPGHTGGTTNIKLLSVNYLPETILRIELNRFK